MQHCYSNSSKCSKSYRSHLKIWGLRSNLQLGRFCEHPADTRDAALGGALLLMLLPLLLYLRKWGRMQPLAPTAADAAALSRFQQAAAASSADACDALLVKHWLVVAGCNINTWCLLLAVSCCSRGCSRDTTCGQYAHCCVGKGVGRTGSACWSSRRCGRDASEFVRRKQTHKRGGMPMIT
jgi:hypothetical protein